MYDFKKALFWNKFNFLSKAKHPDKLIEALQLAEIGQTERAKEIFNKYFQDPNKTIVNLAFQYYSLAFDPKDLLEIIYSKYVEDDIPHNISHIYIMSLCENNKIEKAINYYKKIQPQMSLDRKGPYINSRCLLFLGCYCGKKALVEKMLNILKFQNKTAEKINIAVTDIYSGNIKEAIKILSIIFSDTSSNLLKNKIFHLKSLIEQGISPTKLSEESNNFLNALENTDIKITNIKMLKSTYLFLVALCVFQIFCYSNTTYFNAKKLSGNGNYYTPSMKGSLVKDNLYFNKDNSKLLKIAEQNRTNERLSGFVVYPQRSGMSNTEIQDRWTFSYKGVNYIASYADRLFKYRTLNNYGRLINKNIYIYDDKGNFIISSIEDISKDKIIQVLILPKGKDLYTETATISKGKVKKTNKIFKNLKHPYLEDISLYYQTKNLYKMIPHKPYTFTSFNHLKNNINEFKVFIDKKKNKTKDQPWTYKFKWINPDNGNCDGYYDSITDSDVEYKLNTADIKRTSIGYVFKQRSKNLKTTASAILPLDCWVPDSSHLKSLTLMFESTNGKNIQDSFHKNDRQIVQNVSNSKKAVLVKTSPESLSKKSSNKATPAEIKWALLSSKQNESKNPEIIKQAKEIVKNEKNTTKKALLLANWVKNYVKWTYEIENGTALETLHSKKGDCTEHSDLFIALARAVGIPARSTRGFKLLFSSLEGHQWAEFYSNKWIEIDPSSGKLIDATYFRADKMLLTDEIKKVTVIELNYGNKPLIVNKAQPYWIYKNNHYYNRILGLDIPIPSYNYVNFKGISGDFKFNKSDHGRTIIPASFPKRVNNNLFSIILLPDLTHLNEVINNINLLGSNIVVQAVDHNDELFKLKEMMANNAKFYRNSFNNIYTVEQDGEKYLVVKIITNNGMNYLCYIKQINKTTDILIGVSEPYARLNTQKTVPPLFIDLLKNIKSTKPKIDGSI